MFEYYSDDNLVVKVEFYDGNAYIHCTANKWTKEVLLRCKVLWEQIKTDLLETGFTKVLAVVDPSNKILKFSMLFNVSSVEHVGPYYLLTFKLEN